MLRLLERDPHAQRLRDLLARFRSQEVAVALHLQDLQAELDLLHRETHQQAIDGAASHGAQIARCIGMQSECDALATELVHVRLAIAGVCEEMAEHDRRRFGDANLRLCPTA